MSVREIQAEANTTPKNTTKKSPWPKSPNQNLIINFSNAFTRFPYGGAINPRALKRD